MIKERHRLAPQTAEVSRPKHGIHPYFKCQPDCGFCGFRLAPQITTRRAVALGAVTLLLAPGSSLAAEPGMAAAAGKKACADESTGITLSTGFCATVFADNIGQPSLHIPPISDQ
jgi:hypothetical protein